MRVDTSPPVINKKPPKLAIIKPIIFMEFNFSSKKYKDKIVIATGANKHTNRAGSEGPINWIAVYWLRKIKIHL